MMNYWGWNIYLEIKALAKIRTENLEKLDKIRTENIGKLAKIRTENIGKLDKIRTENWNLCQERPVDSSF